MSGATIVIPVLCCLLYFVFQIYISDIWSAQVRPVQHVGIP